MSWLSKIVPRRGATSPYTLTSVQAKFSRFLEILENNNRVLKIISDMEEKSQGEYLFDINYIRSSLGDVRSGVSGIVTGMIALGGEEYAELKNRYDSINDELSRIFPENRPVEEDEFAIPLERVGRAKAWSVGSKSAQMGEMRSKLGLPVPEGFAISAWAYKHFVDVNNLQERISDRLAAVNIRHFDDLVRVSEQIRSMVSSSPVPDDLAEAIKKHYEDLRGRIPGSRIALRSSAVGEDTIFSFAGQYATFLNVRKHELIDRYRDVLASKFTPQAIYYYLSHSFTETDLAMGVGCVSMVDAVTSGVIYTRDPVQPNEDSIVIYAIFGLGKYLVEGSLAPDVYCVSRRDGRVTDQLIVDKPVRLVLGENGGTVEEPVPESEQTRPALNAEQIGLLAKFAREIEEHYGSPMDIEWAIDRSGQPYLLQARPLRVVEAQLSAEEPDVTGLEVLCEGGVTVCPGAGSGPVFVLRSTKDLSRVPDGAVLVAPLPFPGLVTVMNKVKALVTHVGSTASHMATLAREYRIPTLVALTQPCELGEGNLVTVDATGRKVYAGEYPELVQARRMVYDDVDDVGIYDLLKEVLGHIAPLNLIHPDDPDFVPENCHTFHDITRFVHQRAMQEMFTLGKNIKDKDRVALHLQSDIPLKVLIIYIDQDVSKYKGKRLVAEEDIASVPMKAFWDGIKEEGWPSQGPAGDVKGFMGVMGTSLATNIDGEFSESSFAVLSKEYMILSLRMGYHFTTVESMCTSEASNNYIRFQCKGGGAAPDRRNRRIRVFMELLSGLGFVNTGTGDFIDARIAYLDPPAVARNLRMLGRITMITKQLDMALSNDNITEWYIRDFKKKLGMAEGSGLPNA
jgi:pyruvate,water dikinase